MHAHIGTMANSNGRNGSTTDDNRWRSHGHDFPSTRRDDDYDREGDRRGMGQSGYGSGREAEDRSMGIQNTPAPRNMAWSGTHSDEHDPYGRGRWEEGRIGMSQGYAYREGDRPSFERGMHDERSTGYGYRQHQTGFGGAQGLDLRRGPHRGKGPKGFEHSDARIHERVCEALSDDHNIDASDIEVSVHQGEVTLSGTVDHRDTKRMAEDCVLQCSGVRDVHNQLRIRR
jgi:BON domain